jgi:DNA-binding transcriptional ArsR family regulator
MVMSKDENVLVVQVGQEQATKLATVLANKNCQRIMDALSAKSATETEISAQLAIPLSTVHYNVQQLLKAGLVVSDTFHYSKKGKEVAHYKLTRKYIVITPTPVSLLPELSWVLPLFAGIAYGYWKFLPQAPQPMMADAFEATTMMAKAAPVAASEPQIHVTILWIGLAIFALVALIRLGMWYLGRWVSHSCK